MFALISLNLKVVNMSQYKMLLLLSLVGCAFAGAPFSLSDSLSVGLKDGDISGNTQDVSMTVSYSMPMVEGFELELVGIKSDGAKLRALVSVLPGPQVVETCQGQFYYPQTEASCDSMKSQRKDLPECKRHGDPGCLARDQNDVTGTLLHEYSYRSIKSHFNYSRGLRNDGWIYPPSLYQKLMGLRGFSGKYGQYFINDGAHVVLASNVPKLARDFEIYAMKCPVVSPSYRVLLTVYNEDDEQTDQVTLEYSPQVTSASGTWGSMSLQPTGFSYQGIRGYVSAVTPFGSPNVSFALFGEEDFNKPGSYMMTDKRPVNECSPNVVGLDPEVDVSQNICRYRVSTHPPLDNLVAQFLPLPEVTGCDHSCSLTDRVSGTVCLDVCAYTRKFCDDQTPAACRSNCDYEDIPDMVCETKNCLGQYVDFDITILGVVSLTPSVEHLKGSDLTCSDLHGYYGSDGAIAVLSTTKDGVATFTSSELSPIVPARLVVPMTTSEASDVRVNVWADFGYNLYLIDGTSVECPVGNLEPAGEYVPPDPEDPDRVDNQPQRASFPTWVIVFVVIISLTILAFVAIFCYKLLRK